MPAPRHRTAPLLLPALLALALSPPLFAQSGMRDRYFARYPFEKWRTEGPVAAMKWTVKMQPATLSAHQRLTARIELRIDAREIESRGGRGEMIVFVEIAAPDGRRFRTHEAYDLTRVPTAAKTQPLTFAQDVFVLPGDYDVSLAICDSRTLDHNFLRRSLHVPPLRGDPLPDAGKDLPPIEFVRLFPAPDIWFQPYVRGRLRLPVNPPRPLHIDLVVNLTPSQRFSGSIRAFRRNMTVLVPALKVLSGLDVAGGSLDIALLDLTLRRVWAQPDAKGLDWNRMREPFANANPGVIDVQSLKSKGEMQQFFWDSVLDRLKPRERAEPLRVVIVLSAPVFLERQYKVEPAVFPKDPNRRVFYLRYRPPPPSRPPEATFVMPNGGLTGGVTTPAATSLPSDDLEHTLKLLDARSFNIQNPEDFRRALAAILTEISRM